MHQVDAVRRGRTRYAMATAQTGGGQTWGARILSSLDVFAHEIGHSVGLQHWGHGAWGSGGLGDCVPHYDSLMRYGSTVPTFRSSDTPMSLNPAAAMETLPFGLGYDYDQFLAHPYHYAGQPGQDGVDWSRDGGLSSSSVAWRSTALSLKDAGCKAFTAGMAEIADDTWSVGPVDLVRFGSRLYAFWAVGTEIRYQFAGLGGVGNKSCTGNPDPTPLGQPPQNPCLPPGSPAPDPCLTWTPTATLASSGRFLGVSAYVYDGALFLAWFETWGGILVSRYDADGSGNLVLAATDSLPTSANEYRASHTPELVERHQGVHGRTLGLLYRDLDGTFRSYGWNGSAWEYEGPMLASATGQALTGGEAIAAKAWPDSAVTGWQPDEKRTLAIIPDSAGLVRVYVLDYATNQWTNLGVWLGGAKTTGKPFLEYRTVRTTSGALDAEFSGHFLIGWMSWSATDGARARVRLSSLVGKAAPPAPGSFAALQAGDFLQNEWAKTKAGGAAALYSDSTLDNVFGLVPLDVPGAPPEQGIIFYPHADGAPDHTYTMYSDFRVMEDYICSNIGVWRGYSCASAAVPICVFD